MKITGAVGFAGEVYRAGREAEFDVAIAKAKDAGQPVPDLGALEAAGAIALDADAATAPGVETTGTPAKGKKATKGKK